LIKIARKLGPYENRNYSTMEVERNERPYSSTTRCAESAYRTISSVKGELINNCKVGRRDLMKFYKYPVKKS